MEDTSTLVAELDAWQLRKKFDQLAPPLLATPVFSTHDISLPYHMLGGQGFEKLCHQLLVYDGKSPRLFGKSGQPDFGADILVEESDKRTVYQCKNLEKKPSMAQIIQTIEKFKQDWLNTAGLPTPTNYVYCCPHLLNAVKDNEDFMLFGKIFKAQAGVEIQFQDKAFYDAKLKRLPDIVAGLFGDTLTQYFCGKSTEHIERWRPITYAVAIGNDSVGRFMKRHQQQKIYVSDEVRDWFTDAYSRSNIMMIRGLPGHGKTTVGLELITELEKPFRRIYYRTLKETFDLVEMVDSIQRHLSLPSFFVLDDCHLHLDKLGDLLERLQPELNHPNRHVAVLLISRHVAPDKSEEAVDAYDFMEELENKGLCMDFTKSNTRQVLEFLRPDMLGLSKARLIKIEEFTGGDLLLLDEMIDILQVPNEIDNFKLDRLLERIKRRDLNGVDSPALLRLACLAQFDLAPFKDYFKSENNDLHKWQSSLLTEIGKPRRYDLSHSSMASLYFRALAKDVVGTDEKALSEVTIRELVVYFKFFETQVHQEGISIDFLVEELQSVIQEQLPLFDHNNSLLIRASFLNNPSIVQLMVSKLDNIPISSLSISAQITSLATPEVENLYVGLLLEKFIRLLKGTPSLMEVYPMFGPVLRLLRRNAPDKFDELEVGLRVENLLQFIITHGSITELFNAVQVFSHAFAQSLLSALDEEKAEVLLQKTITSERSIGTLDMAMFSLGKTAEGKELLEDLEMKVGPGRFLELILRNGTLYELFNVIKHSTYGFAHSLLSALDEEKAEVLLQKTIASGRSIGTLDMTMFMLGKTKEGKELLKDLEMKIGPERFLELILRNGTLFELFNVIKHSTYGFAQLLMSVLDERKAEVLLQKTIDSGRSIGTLNFSLFMMGKTVEGKEVQEDLETKVGPGRFLDLILCNGTLFEFFRVLQYSTPRFAQSLLSALDERKAEALLQKTIASGRSIGTLHLAMFELGKTEEGKEMQEELEMKLDAVRFLDLILCNGTLFELFGVLQYSTPTFAHSLLSAMDERKAEALLQKTIASRRSIGTLHLAMFELGKTEKGKEVQVDLERKLGAGRFLELILCNGTLIELFRVLQYCTPSFAHSLLAALDEGKANVLLDKGFETGRSMESWMIGLIMFKRFPQHISKIEDPVRWWGIFKQNGTLNSLCSIREAMRNEFRDAFIAASVSLHEEEWAVLIADSQLPKICQVYSEILSFYPEGTKQAFQAAFKTGITAAVAKSDWRNLHAAKIPEPNMVEEVLPGVKEFKEALQLRTNQAKIKDLLRLPFLEAINAIAFLWRENETHREKLVTHFWEILPEPSTWDMEEDYVGALRLLMNVACSAEFPANEANKLIEILKKPWSVKTYKKIHTNPLFLYYWNLAALSYERGGRYSFQQVLPEATKSALFDILKIRVNRKNHLEEVHSLFCLLGLLYFLYPSEKSHIERIVKKNIRVNDTLRKLLGDASFIPAFFGWFGVSALERLENNYTPFINVQLIMKAESYDEKGPAIEYLVKKTIDFNAGNWSPWNRI